MTTLEMKVNGSLIGLAMVQNMRLIRPGLYEYQGKFMSLVLKEKERFFKVNHYKEEGLLVLYRLILEQLTD